MPHFLEFHLIQNFAPSNLNRDDTGSPKDALFGGHRRARISSQCLKRSVRDWFGSSDLLSADSLGVRTRHLDRVLTEELKAAGLAETGKFNELVKLALKPKKKDKGDSKDESSGEGEGPTLAYMLFISAVEIDAIKLLIRSSEALLQSLAAKAKLKAGDIPDEFRAGLKSCLAKSKAVDVALFGRMLADMPAVNQDAACQVAHAISTHRVEREFDYFTAVDDNEEDVVTGMIGQVEFNSATFYRYAVVDLAKLLSNLQGDRELVLAAINAFTLAAARAVPSGKQNSFAAHNPPQFIGVCLREGGPMNLANAFECPVTPRREQSLTEQSVHALDTYETRLAAIYGSPQDRWLALDLTGQWPDAKGLFKGSLVELAQQVRALAESALPASAA